MTVVTVTAAEVAACYPDEAEILDVIAYETVTAGAPAYQTSAGTFGLADANGSGTRQFRGIFLTGGGAGQAVSLLKRGHCYGYTLSGIAYDGLAYLSDTVGRIDDSVGTLTVNVGRVVALPNADLTKVLWVEADWLRTWV